MVKKWRNGTLVHKSTQPNLSETNLDGDTNLDGQQIYRRVKVKGRDLERVGVKYIHDLSENKGLIWTWN